MKDNEYTRKEQICPLVGDYCNEEDKNCDKCISDEEIYERNQCFFTHLPNPDGTVDLHMNQKMLNKNVESFCKKDIENYDQTI